MSGFIYSDYQQQNWFNDTPLLIQLYLYQRWILFPKPRCHSKVEKEGLLMHIFHNYWKFITGVISSTIQMMWTLNQFCCPLYLKRMWNLRLVLGGEHTTLTGYSDANWASQISWHSISGYTFFIGDRAVSWRSKKQPIITLSSTKSEYITFTHSAKEILSRQCLPHSNMHTKHIDTHFHFIWQIVNLQ